MMTERTEQLLEQMIVQLDRIAREQKTTRELISKFVYAMVDEAEREIPEKYRRFCNAMHDIHDIKYMYEDVGSAVPPHILRACERFDDRFRQIEKDMNAEDGAFSKIRREMSTRDDAAENRWDHTRLLYPPKKENEDETRKS
jgi:hypothetical protein